METIDAPILNDFENHLNSLMASSVKVVENGRHICLICNFNTKTRNGSDISRQRASMQNHMRKHHLGIPMSLQPNFQGKICCPSCHVLYSSDVEFLDHVCLTCYNYITRVYEEKASEYLRKFKSMPLTEHFMYKMDHDS